MSQFQSIHVPLQTIREAADGDAVAHEAIYRQCSRPIYSAIRRLIPNAATAEDIFQDVFVEILRSIGSYSGEGSFGGWVRTIAVNKCLMHLRSPWHRSLFWMDADQEAFVPVDPHARPDGQEITHDLERALATLPPLTRSVVWLHDVEGYKHHEIAQLLGRTTAFSKSQLARAHVRLRKLLDPQSSEPHMSSLSSPEVEGGSLSCTPLSTSC